MSNADFGDKPRRQWAPDARALSVVGDRWLMVIVRDLAAGPLRLDVLRRWLPGVSAGALQARLERMEEAGLLERRRHRSLPPRVDLELTQRGFALAGVIGELARWELRTCWSSPSEDEWVDVAACFRLAPFLHRTTDADTHGELALTILGADGDLREHYAFVLEHGRAKVERRTAPTADAQLSGTEDDWVRALGPGDDANPLAIAGRRGLADDFLALFAAAAPGN